MQFSSVRDFRYWLLQILGLTLAYAVAGRLSLLLAIPPGYSMAVYPPAGIALGIILTGGYRLLPGVAAGSFLVNLLIGLENSGQLNATAVLLSALLATGACLQAGISCLLVRRRLKNSLTLDTDRAILHFFLYGGLFGCLISASVGITSLYALGILPATETLNNWLTWWIGDTLGVLTITPIVLTLTARPREIWFSRRWNVMLPLIVCLLLVITAFVFIRLREQQKQQLEFKLQAERLSQNLQNSLDSHSDAVKNIERLYASTGHVNRKEFATFVEYTIQNYAAISSLQWAPRITRGQRTTFEDAVRQEGFPGFQLNENNQQNQMVSSAQREDYYPVTYYAPFAADSRVFGYDMGSSVIRRNAIEDARDSGNLTVTDPLTLLSGTGDQLSVLLYAPLYARGKPLENMEQRKQAFTGVALSVLRMEHVIRNLLPENEKKFTLLKFYDLSYPGQRGIFFDNIGQPDKKNLSQFIINFGGRQYALLAQPSPAYWKFHVSWITWISMIGGLLFTGLLGIYLLMVTAHTFNVETLVAQRTAQLHNSEERLRAIFGNAAEGILTTDEKGIVESANQSAESLFGYPLGGLYGHSIFKLFPARESEEFLLQYASGNSQDALRSPATEISGRTDVLGKKRSGDEIPLELAVTRVELGPQILLIIILHDLSEKKRVEKLKNEFVSAVSHELRTPLTSIRGALGLLIGGVGGEVSDTAKVMLGMANDNAVRLTALINDLLDFEKLEYGGMQFKFEILPLSELVEKSVLANLGYAQNFGVGMQFDAAGATQLKVFVDPQRYLQVLSNLLSNAIKFSRENGKIDIRISRQDQWAKVEVQDYGIGISEVFRDSIFQKFTQEDAKAARRYAGTGLGLSLSKTMMEKMGGKIGFTSVEGRGSTFYVELPLVTDSAADTPSATDG